LAVHGENQISGCVEIVQKDNNELIMGNDIFQLGELVDPY
jgi:hypothetical protein